MLSLWHGKLPKVVLALFTTLNWWGGRGGVTNRKMFIYFAILAGMVSRAMSKFVE
jgi:hypothetical protein